MKADESSKSTFIGQFVYSINDIKYEWVDAYDFEDARNKLHNKSDWNNDRYDLNVFCSESYAEEQHQALTEEVENSAIIEGKQQMERAVMEVVKSWEENIDDKVGYGEMLIDLENAIERQYPRH